MKQKSFFTLLPWIISIISTVGLVVVLLNCNSITLNKTNSDEKADPSGTGVLVFLPVKERVQAGDSIQFGVFPLYILGDYQMAGVGAGTQNADFNIDFSNARKRTFDEGTFYSIPTTSFAKNMEQQESSIFLNLSGDLINSEGQEINLKREVEFIIEKTDEE